MLSCVGLYYKDFEKLYSEGGNDESVYKADFNFIEIDDYTTLVEKMQVLP